MTVLVSAVREMIRAARGARGRVRVDGRHLGGAGGVLRGGGASPRWCCCRATRCRRAALQPLANGALVLSLDTDFDGCMKVVQALTEARRRSTSRTR
jgi:threonine synthase